MSNTGTPSVVRVTRAFMIVVCAVILGLLILGFVRDADAATATQPQVARVAASSQVRAAVSTTPKRIIAYQFARAQHGEPYRYGASGPGSWDCSGLVQAAYKKAGISLPRTTGEMLRDPGDKLYRTNHPRNGDLVLSEGHVELYTHYKNGRHIMYGAHHSGTTVGWKPVYSGLRFYHVRASS